MNTLRILLFIISCGISTVGLGGVGATDEGEGNPTDSDQTPTAQETNAPVNNAIAEQNVAPPTQPVPPPVPAIVNPPVAATPVQTAQVAPRPTPPPPPAPAPMAAPLTPQFPLRQQAMPPTPVHSATLPRNPAYIAAAVPASASRTNPVAAPSHNDRLSTLQSNSNITHDTNTNDSAPKESSAQIDTPPNPGSYIFFTGMGIAGSILALAFGLYVRAQHDERKDRLNRK